jgi:DNA-binding transcriptional LysR family regulator
MLNLNDARLFVKVVDSEGFSPAARALELPKSTVSKRIAELEHQLGTPLLHRSSRRFVLTPVGREFHRHAAAMVALAEDAEASVRGHLAEPAGTVRITSSIPAAQTWLAELLPALAARYPKVRIVHHATDRFVDVVRDGFDMAVRSHATPLADSDLVRRHLGTDPFWLVASPRYLKQRGAPRRPEELAAHDAVLARPAATSLTLTHARGETCTIAPPVRFFADESQMLLAAARAHLGFTCVPRRHCKPDLDRGALRRVLPDWTAGHITTTLLVPERRAELPAIRALSDAFAAHFAKELPLLSPPPPPPPKTRSAASKMRRPRS